MFAPVPFSAVRLRQKNPAPALPPRRGFLLGEAAALAQSQTRIGWRPIFLCGLLDLISFRSRKRDHPASCGSVMYDLSRKSNFTDLHRLP